MGTLKRGIDAQDRAPSPETDRTPQAERNGADAKQDAPNYKTSDKQQAINVEDMNSANDEGAG